MGGFIIVSAYRSYKFHFLINHIYIYIYITFMQPRNEKFVGLGDDRRDGRRICNDCFSTAILETQGIEPLVRYVLRFFDHLNMKIKAPIPVFSVDRGEMRRQTAGGTAVGVKSNPLPF